MGQCGLNILGVTERTGVPELAEFPSTGAGKSVMVSKPRRGGLISLGNKLRTAAWSGDCSPCRGPAKDSDLAILRLSPGRISVGTHSRSLQSLAHGEIFQLRGWRCRCGHFYFHPLKGHGKPSGNKSHTENQLTLSQAPWQGAVPLCLGKDT